MPLTFPSHAALPLPLKLWRPRWFDGVALTVGSTAPDFAYALDGSGLLVHPFAHRPLGALLFCLPLTLLCCLLIRWSAPGVASHLPARPSWLALRDYGALGTRPTFMITAASALLGALSHQAWDEATRAAPLFDTLSSVLGVPAFIAIVVHIGRRRLIRTWHGDAPARATRPALFWSVTAAVLATGTLVALQLPGAFLWHTTVPRLLAVAGLALIAGAATIRNRTPAKAATA
ncbi:DUF4184 family protein [Catenuloplanes japonicus]|uniref:DUF4184 family protein n=1 Tax=Catenuloplanes japonicus TaxID=33876 RepID=UPI00068CD7D4|nr:DUF4184 family protein [Catenuloplanes japonicus]